MDADWAVVELEDRDELGPLSFETVYAPELQLGRYLITVPFNLWQAFRRKGNFEVNCILNGIGFVCGLLPRGNGMYAIPFTKAMQKRAQLKSGDIFTITIGLYQREEPRKGKEVKRSHVNSIRLVRQNSPKTCGQACIAMLAHVTIEEAIKTMKTSGPTTIGQIIEALDFYHIAHAAKNTRLSKKNPNLPTTAILTVHLPEYAHWVLFHRGQYFDPEFGLLNECVKEGRITSFLEIE